MSVRILEDRETYECALYCSTSGVAFGPIIVNREAAEKFLQEYLGHDARTYSETALINCYSDFCHTSVCECGSVITEDEPAHEGVNRYECSHCTEKKAGVKR